MKGVQELWPTILPLPSFFPPPSSSRHRSRYGTCLSRLPRWHYYSHIIIRLRPTHSFGRIGQTCLSAPQRLRLALLLTGVASRLAVPSPSFLRRIASVREFKWKRKKIYSSRNYRVSRVECKTEFHCVSPLPIPLLISASSSFARQVEFYLAHFRLP